MKKTFLTTVCGLSLLIAGTPVLSNPNFVATSGAHYDAQGQLIPPDKYFLRLALKNYQDGFNELSYSYFKKAAAFGNSVAQKYIGLMHIKALGVNRDWAEGYAWIKLAARDKTAANLELEQQIKKILTPEELTQSEQIFKTIEQDYDDLAALKRRDAWVKKQKRQVTGSRVGAQTSNVYTYKADGELVSANGTQRFDAMTAFVEDFNYGYVDSGEIVPIEESTEKAESKK